MIPHFESAVRAVDEAGEDAFDAVRRLGLPHLFLVNADNRIPNLAGNDWLMGPLHSNPLVFGLRHQLLGFVGEGPTFALDHVPDIGFVAEHDLDGVLVPQVVDAAGVGAALALVVQLTGRLDALRVEDDGNLSERHAGGPHCKNAADHGRGLLVDDEAVLVGGVSLVAVGSMGSHVFPAFRAGFLHRLNLFACIPAVKFVK